MGAQHPGKVLVGELAAVMGVEDPGAPLARWFLQGLNAEARIELAGALAWWVPGSRNVINGIEVAPPQELNDNEVAEAVRLALEKDPLLNADAIGVITRNRVAVLEGYVVSPGEKEIAEMDTWCVFGVDLVINRLEVQQ